MNSGVSGDSHTRHSKSSTKNILLKAKGQPSYSCDETLISLYLKTPFEELTLTTREYLTPVLTLLAG